MTKSIEKIKDLNSWITSRLIRRIGLTIFLGMVFILILDAYYFLSSSLNTIHSDMKSFSANQIKNLQVFNYYRVSTDLKVFAKHTSAEYVEFFDQHGLRIAFAGTVLPASKIKTLRNNNTSWRLSVHSGDVFVVIDYPIHPAQVGFLGHLSAYVSTSKQIEGTLRHLVVYFIVLIIVFLWSIREVRRSAISISGPIEELSAVFSNIRLPADFPQVDTKMNIREIAVLFESFYQMTERLRVAEEKNARMAELRAMAKTVQTITHDLKKPFTFIKSMLDVFADMRHDPDKLTKAKIDIQKSIRHIDNMLDDIMNYAREVRVTAKPESISDILSYCVNEIVKTTNPSTIQFVTRLKNKKRPMVDSSRISRVFSNIVLNAIEAITTSECVNDGLIYLGAKDLNNDGQNYVQIHIANNGPLVDESHIQHIFETFFTAGKKKGTGLGLASAKKIVDLHEGTITVSNISPNQTRLIESINGTIRSGVLFTIILPASEEHEVSSINASIADEKDAADSNRIHQFEQSATPRKLPVNGYEYSILLLEDESIYCEYLEKAIKKTVTPKNRLRIFTARRVSEALDIFNNEKITHSIVDIELQQLSNGFDFVTQAIIDNNGGYVPFLIHTNQHSEENRKKSIELGAWGITAKPLAEEILISFLSDVDNFHSRSRKLPTIAPQSEALPAASVTILLVNDEPLLLESQAMFIKNHFSKHGKTAVLVTAQSGDAALNIIANQPNEFDVIISDMNISYVNEGLAIAEELHEMSIDIPFYLLTSANLEVMKEFIPLHFVKDTFRMPISESILDQIFGLPALVSSAETETGLRTETATGNTLNPNRIVPPGKPKEEPPDFFNLSQIACYTGSEVANRIGSIVRHIMTPLQLMNRSILNMDSQEVVLTNNAVAELPLVLYKQASILECMADQFVLPNMDSTRFTNGAFGLLQAIESTLNTLSKSLGDLTKDIRFKIRLHDETVQIRGKADILEKAILRLVSPAIDRFQDDIQNGEIEFTSSGNNGEIQLIVSYNCVTVTDERLLNELLGSIPISECRYDIEYDTCALYIQLLNAKILANVSTTAPRTTFLLSLLKYS